MDVVLVVEDRGVLAHDRLNRIPDEGTMSSWKGGLGDKNSSKALKPNGGIPLLHTKEKSKTENIKIPTCQSMPPTVQIRSPNKVAPIPLKPP